MKQKWAMPHLTRNLSILIFSVTIGILLSISQSSAFETYVIHPTSTMTVHTDKTSYNLGGVVTISGIVTGISPSYQYQEPSGKVGLLLYSDNYLSEKILVDVSSSGPIHINSTLLILECTKYLQHIKMSLLKELSKLAQNHLRPI